MNSEEEKNNFMPLMDISSASNDLNPNQNNKIIDINEVSDQYNNETVD
jgi:hypothetical protein